MRLRAAAPGDAAAVAAIWNRHIRQTAVTFDDREKDVAQVAALIATRRDAGLFVVATEGGGALAGFATAGAFRAGPGYRHTLEISVHVAPPAQGRGVGRALVGALEAAARAAGAHVLVAAVSGENPGAVAFHAGLGFAEVGRMPQVGRKFDRWLDLIVMQKFL
ncbi:MAG: GNAT family N-acetyltransferase [Roseovarius sp.]